MEPIQQIGHLGNLLRSDHDGQILVGLASMAHEGVAIAAVLQLLHHLDVLIGFQQDAVDSEVVIAGLVRLR